ncbi:hypothetical protein Q5H91_11090 [Sphingomonas sp. KR1UV-12]|uniref:ApeA N-terminal domain-containing protein n=1 Tax=Sphingomonas aurea TaxID=3063994 RepID=A0ABT9ELC9_9SPHN|nr:hypothetical protein [Sphingomonas sp. KR1UV-12]MDP1027761.1 hypothetical protein [Sphingomonas sp. KR1UV-12]
MTTSLSPKFFELSDVRAVEGRSWIALRHDEEIRHESPSDSVGGIRAYTGIATLAVLASDRATVDAFTWDDVDPSAHRPSLDGGHYRPVDAHCDWSEERKVVGTRLVLAQAGSGGGFAPETWHLHQDLVFTLRLVREGDAWFRPEEGWIEAARLKRGEEGRPVLLEIRAEMLSDYLAARGMALFVSGYHERAAYFEAKPPYEWADEHRQVEAGRDSREAYVTEAEFPPEPRYRFRALGALWRTEWWQPGTRSTRVRGDSEPGEATFAAGPSGERKTAEQCVGAMTYLAFQPSLVPALLRYRGGSLGWYSRETGGLAGADTGMHFGVNTLGLVTIFAKDIAKLDGWEQRVWAAHSTPLDGGVAGELWDTQMNCRPADTVAPETRLESALNGLNEAFQTRFGVPLLREHGSVAGILKRTHRFRAVEHDGLLALAKELNRLLMERLDLDALRGAASIGKEKLGTLKALERLLERTLGQVDARTMMAPLFGINDLRNADAHLGSSQLESGLDRARVDHRHANPVEQGCQLLEAFVATVGDITIVISRDAEQRQAGAA